MSMADLLAQSSGEATKGEFFPFPSLDNLNESCSGIIQSRDVTKGIEEGFLAAKPALKSVLDPITQPLSWLSGRRALDLCRRRRGSSWCPSSWRSHGIASRSVGVTFFVADRDPACLGLVDHYDVAMQTLSIIFVCTGISVMLGVPYRYRDVEIGPIATGCRSRCLTCCKPCRPLSI